MGSYWKTVGSLWDFTRNPLGLVMDPKRIPLGIPRGLPLYSKVMPFRFQRDANGFQSIFNRVQVDSNAPPMRVLLDSAWMQSGLNWDAMGFRFGCQWVFGWMPIRFWWDSCVIPMLFQWLPIGFQGDSSCIPRRFLFYSNLNSK